MTTITRETRINAPKNEVWAILADVGGVHRYSPGVSHSYSTSDANNGVGATRHCDFNSGGASVEERVVEWHEGESYVIEIFEGSRTPPFEKALASLSVQEDGDGTLFKGTLEYTMRYGLAGNLMNKMMVERQFTQSWDGIVAGLKHYAETGEVVESSQQIDFSAVLAPA